MRRAKSIVVIGGSKGGVGKSLMSMATIDWLTAAKGQKVLVIDGDESNPDVAKVCQGLEPPPRLLNLDDRDGWLNLSDRCSAHGDAHVVVNTGGRSLRALQQWSGQVLAGIHKHLGRASIMLWVINDQRDSVELLRQYMDSIQQAGAQPPWMRLHVVCNAGEVETRSFAYYDETHTAAAIARAGGKVLRVSMLAKRVTTLLYTDRMPIAAVADPEKHESVPFSARIEMERWRREVWNELDSLELAGT